ncbi:ras guanine nucleotide exchange factor domain-containing protein [Mucor mucedo]|uniref:ras guanine nucleotide exchange factor domain-containing protein n=1 Tax=Mucor mucedo TaxID=29922 RepID=UPI00221ED736|nr:ras guanine nucleotide exchange factor domain-containing protein [Mucor mucedo]KAI7889925.1 ras guanine nucleotide exchange factor domain-containing protein [Mucor mucedo]
MYTLKNNNSEKIKTSHNDTVGKRFIRSISSLKKSHHHNVSDSNSQSRLKIDEERTIEGESLKKTKNSLRFFFGGNKRQPKDIFENSNESDSTNKRASVQTLISPYARNISVRTTNDFDSSDSACFTTTSDITDTMVTTSIQREFAEPVFVKEQPFYLKHNRSENDLRVLTSILKPWGPKELKRCPSQLSLVNKLYNMNTNEDEDDKILRKVKEKGKEGSILHVSENGEDVLVMEMVQSNKLQVLAGTLERLFMKLADESSQDLDYVDTYILSHLFFTDSIELLENLMARFHLEALPGEANYFKKWQRCIQVKVLNVISRWIKLQFEDFTSNPVLITRLEAFLNGDVDRAGFTVEADMIKESLDRQNIQYSKSRHSFIVQTSQSLVSFGNSCTTTNNPIVRRPSVTPSFLSFVSYSTPPDSPLYSPDVFLSLNSKDIARYLTLADFYILKCITAQDYLTIYYPGNIKKKNKDHIKIDYVAMMTERANRLSKWVVEEIIVHKINSKQRRMTIRKMIEIAKLCLNWNNFHTSMVLTMGLTQLQEFRDNTWQQVSLLPNRDVMTLKQLIKYLNVCNNMSYYRQAFKKAAKAPCIPFFPIVLKDLTFLMDGNATINDNGLVNFTKFRMLIQSIHSVLNYTIENYYFASELEYFPFFPNQNMVQQPQSSLDMVATTLETQIKSCCIDDPYD